MHDSFLLDDLRSLVSSYDKVRPNIVSSGVIFPTWSWSFLTTKLDWRCWEEGVIILFRSIFGLPFAPSPSNVFQTLPVSTTLLRWF